jgi:hypothetical protein
MQFMQQQAAIMAAAATQGSYISPMAALAASAGHPPLTNGLTSPVVPPSSAGQYIFKICMHQLAWLVSFFFFF